MQLEGEGVSRNSKIRTALFMDGPLMKNSHILSNPHETWRKQSPHESIIFIKFHADWIKNVDFYYQ